ncbi:hypothetical protein LSH36_324g01013 [Paralvinella palmiformis]|uniref:Uncharacterized protein n=1 Tax=Paralvinella palmiformis TaxID=53620 RepID=A0AAD9JGB5_9ANNE|nr:hypothetical protein LSH36_324g01013 [Paralvinella palmiformis]
MSIFSINRLLILWCFIYHSTLVVGWLTRPKQAPVLHRLNCDKANAFFGKRLNPFCQSTDPEKRGANRHPLRSVIDMLNPNSGEYRHPEGITAGPRRPGFGYFGLERPLMRRKDSNGEKAKEMFGSGFATTERGRGLPSTGDNIWSVGRLLDKFLRHTGATSVITNYR